MGARGIEVEKMELQYWARNMPTQLWGGWFMALAQLWAAAGLASVLM